SERRAEGRDHVKAAVQKAVNVVEVEDVAEPTINPHQIKIQVAFAGLCGTDMEILEGTFGLAKGPFWEFPKIEGHEASGVVVEVGSDTNLGFKVGQRVAAVPLSPCGECYHCRTGQEHYCEFVNFYSGAFAEYAVYNEGQVFPIDDDVSFEAAAILEPVAIALRSVELAHISPGSYVAILGGGAIGSLTLEVALKAGATKLMISEPVAFKRDLALKLGATVAVDPLSQNLDEVAAEVTKGRGFDAVIDCTGRLEVAKQALGLAGPCAHVVWSAVYPEHGEVPVNAYQMYLKDLSIHGVFMAPYLMWRANRMLSVLDLAPITSHIYALDDINQAFEDQRKGKVIKALIRP
ncbi:MAG TPA: alcohol dehydrogenase catalytic domain-containing protein, partial [Thermoleophilia bacterium]|nr:alcohol dehydrogenase catalytic domain-containing protein [Thermoleophilia bacterium]